MRSLFLPKTDITLHNCKSKTVIEVNSERYNKDEAYQKKIDNQLNKMKS